MDTETATIELEKFERPISRAIDKYYLFELDAAQGGRQIEDLAYAAYRVRLGRDAFRVQVLLDNAPGTADAVLLEEARHRVVSLLRAGSQAAAGLVRWT